MLLAIDIGGTAVKLGLVDESGVIHARSESSVNFDAYKTPILTTALQEVRTFLAREGVPIRGIGISATGQIDDALGVVIGTNGKIPGYEGAPIKDAFEKAFSLPVHVLNDANAAALGECFAGRAKGMSNVLMVTLGTGVGGGIVLGGQIVGGTRGIAGELGHFTLDINGPLCPCGRHGCFESYASTAALIRMAKAASGEGTLTGRDVFARAAQGDARMLSVLDRWIDVIAAGLSGLVHIFNPQMVLIGGGVSAQEALLMQPLRRRVLGSVMPRFAEGLRVESAALGNDAGMIGAAKFWMDRQTESSPAPGERMD